jgi:hypothetical protein
MGQKLYTLTREGRQVVQRLEEGGEHTRLTAPPPPQPASRLTRDQEKILLGLLGSTAVHKFEEGLKNELTFGDACRYWGISENLHGSALDQKLERQRQVIVEIDHLIGNTNVELANGRSVSREDMSLLTAVHEWLTDRFSRHLSLLRNRGVRN